ncbi:hypothetical protein FRACYDRAFT_249996 [Fragilariopsis cylindrus CCMP1102]|uniref:Uncharacterized protein n=1 Tax=Fragilariopsis cylindrus CCMP1102 TaxID=635003 RepID=A0A1E7EQH2_9STRA|nr:hypothetical protein FRACYDRAFT_249996 [Fragilariopsis cylindrus CCMP1102]|eukprot:OEU08208.1 hypothetical protein FRACYDRAFT_249996 [Fragilariopsis cylindrus CCMP1102]
MGRTSTTSRNTKRRTRSTSGESSISRLSSTYESFPILLSRLSLSSKSREDKDVQKKQKQLQKRKNKKISERGGGSVRSKSSGTHTITVTNNNNNNNGGSKPRGVAAAVTAAAAAVATDKANADDVVLVDDPGNPLGNVVDFCVQNIHTIDPTKLNIDVDTFCRTCYNQNLDIVEDLFLCYGLNSGTGGKDKDKQSSASSKEEVETKDNNNSSNTTADLSTTIRAILSSKKNTSGLKNKMMILPGVSKKFLRVISFKRKKSIARSDKNKNEDDEDDEDGVNEQSLVRKEVDIICSSDGVVDNEDDDDCHQSNSGSTCTEDFDVDDEDDDDEGTLLSEYMDDNYDHSVSSATLERQYLEHKQKGRKHIIAMIKNNHKVDDKPAKEDEDEEDAKSCSSFWVVPPLSLFSATVGAATFSSIADEITQNPTTLVKDNNNNSNSNNDDANIVSSAILVENTRDNNGEEEGKEDEEDVVTAGNESCNDGVNRKSFWAKASPSLFSFSFSSSQLPPPPREGEEDDANIVIVVGVEKVAATTTTTTTTVIVDDTNNDIAVPPKSTIATTAAAAKATAIAIAAVIAAGAVATTTTNTSKLGKITVGTSPTVGAAITGTSPKNDVVDVMKENKNRIDEEQDAIMKVELEIILDESDLKRRRSTTMHIPKIIPWKRIQTFRHRNSSTAWRNPMKEDNSRIDEEQEQQEEDDGIMKVELEIILDESDLKRRRSSTMHIPKIIPWKRIQSFRRGSSSTAGRNPINNNSNNNNNNNNKNSNEDANIHQYEEVDLVEETEAEAEAEKPEGLEVALKDHTTLREGSIRNLRRRRLMKKALIGLTTLSNRKSSPSSSTRERRGRKCIVISIITDAAVAATTAANTKNQGTTMQEREMIDGCNVSVVTETNSKQFNERQKAEVGSKDDVVASSNPSSADNMQNTDAATSTSTGTGGEVKIPPKDQSSASVMGIHRWLWGIDDSNKSAKDSRNPKDDDSRKYNQYPRDDDENSCSDSVESKSNDNAKGKREKTPLDTVKEVEQDYHDHDHDHDQLTDHEGDDYSSASQYSSQNSDEDDDTDDEEDGFFDDSKSFDEWIMDEHELLTSDDDDEYDGNESLSLSFLEDNGTLSGEVQEIELENKSVSVNESKNTAGDEKDELDSSDDVIVQENSSRKDLMKNAAGKNVDNNNDNHGRLHQRKRESFLAAQKKFSKSFRRSFASSSKNNKNNSSNKKKKGKLIKQRHVVSVKHCEPQTTEEEDGAGETTIETVLLKDYAVGLLKDHRDYDSDSGGMLLNKRKINKNNESTPSNSINRVSRRGSLANSGVTFSKAKKFWKQQSKIGTTTLTIGSDGNNNNNNDNKEGDDVASNGDVLNKNKKRSSFFSLNGRNNHPNDAVDTNSSRHGAVTEIITVTSLPIHKTTPALENDSETPTNYRSLISSYNSLTKDWYGGGQYNDENTAATMTTSSSMEQKRPVDDDDDDGADNNVNNKGQYHDASYYKEHRYNSLLDDEEDLSSTASSSPSWARDDIDDDTRYIRLTMNNGYSSFDQSTVHVAPDGIRE